MKQIGHPYVVGVVAGGVAALLYLSFATGSLIGIILFYLTPLPGLIAGFGWGVRGAIVAGGTGALLTSAGLGPTAGAAFVVSLAIPAVLLTHFSFLYRTPMQAEGGEQTKPEDVEWYPVGHLVLLIAAYGGSLALLTVLMTGVTFDSYLSRIGTELNTIIAQATAAGLFKQMPPEDIARYKILIATILPASVAILWVIFTLVNAWLAAYAVKQSGMLARPWPDFATFNVPTTAAIIMLVLGAASLVLGGMPALVLSGYAAALATVFIALGLGVVHFVTRDHPLRGVLIIATYVAAFFILWGAVLLLMLGIIEPFMQFRQRKKSAPS